MKYYEEPDNMYLYVFICPTFICASHASHAQPLLFPLAPHPARDQNQRLSAGRRSTSPSVLRLQRPKENPEKTPYTLRQGHLFYEVS